MGKFVKGDVVVAPSPFSDLSAAKKRPALVPDLGKVREFAAKLHAEGKPWKGEVFVGTSCHRISSDCFIEGGLWAKTQIIAYLLDLRNTC